MITPQPDQLPIAQDTDEPRYAGRALSRARLAWGHAAVHVGRDVLEQDDEQDDEPTGTDPLMGDIAHER